VNRFDLPQPYLLFLGDVTEPGFAKTAFGLKDWAPERCVGEIRLTETTVTTGLSHLSPGEAYARGARALLVAVAPQGGRILPHWVPTLRDALRSGLDLISGMHTKLVDIPELVHVAEQTGRRLCDVRTPPRDLPIATGRPRSGKRLLTVGTDCALGKKYTALALAQAIRHRGIHADFRATGQTGIMIAGSGIPIDSVVADFVAGAAELLSPDNEANHWDIIEGQGSIFHPAYAGVSLGLLHGSQPDVLVLCHEAGRERLMGMPGFAVPTLEEAIHWHLTLARRVNSRVRCAGVSLNTSKLSEDAAYDAIGKIRSSLGLPCADPLRTPREFEDLVEACLASAKD
jgi:uncharacterized NAD-dependent epimerase/dehydratase family protein